MKLKLFTIIFSVMFLLSTGVFAQKTTEYIVISDKKVDCVKGGNTKCMQIKKPQDTEWQNFRGQIENFRYQDGYFYLLQVSKIGTKNHPDNASSVKYRLKRIINREKSGDVSTAKPLAGTKWILDKIEGKKVNTDRAFITFDIEKESFGGNGGCNGMGGDLEVEGSSIEMSQIISTKIYCQDTSAIENKFFEKLEEANRYEIRGGTLYIYKRKMVLMELKAG